MKILWFSWKDISHPYAGGAEVMSDRLIRGLAQDGHEIVLITSGYKNSKNIESDGKITIVRLGNKYTVYVLAAIYYLRTLQGWPDSIVEEINTIPFLTQLYARKRVTLLIYQLCREIWFYEMSFPLSLIGYIIEPIYLHFLKNNYVLTESSSTKNDLIRYGFKKNNIQVFPVAIDEQKNVFAGDKYDVFTVLSFGSIRKMKRTLDQVKAFEIARDKIADLKMIIAGSTNTIYGQKVLDYISKSRHCQAISYLGQVLANKKTELMARSHVILVTSVKEGWGLIVTEAARLGTPAIVYNVDGLRESVVPDKTGIICAYKSIISLSNAIQELFQDKNRLHKMSIEAFDHSLQFNEKNSLNLFKEFLLRT